MIPWKERFAMVEPFEEEALQEIVDGLGADLRAVIERLCGGSPELEVLLGMARHLKVHPEIVLGIKVYYAHVSWTRARAELQRNHMQKEQRQ